MKLLYFTDNSHKETVRTLVRKNYPGLLENGFVTWEQLDSRRYRRAGGFSLEFAKKVVQLYNEKVDKFKLTTENMNEWQTDIDFSTRKIGNEVEKEDYQIPSHELDGERQLLYASFPKDTSDPKVKQEFVDMACAMKRTNKYIVSPWRHPENDPRDPMTRWNLLLNQSMANIAVNSNPETFNLRIVVPENFEETLTRASIYEGMTSTLVAVLLLRYHDVDGYIGSMPKDRLPPNVKPTGFIPLFIYHGRDNYRIYNYRGDQVEWGDFSKRKTYFYYELRDIMAHLSNENERWYMYQLPTDGVLRHYIIGKKKLEDETNRKCITWTRDSKSITISDFDNSCSYDGDSGDFKRYGEEMGEELQLNLLRNDLIPKSDVDTSESEYEADYDDPGKFVSCGVMVRPMNFGIYGEKREGKTHNHLNTAYENWDKIFKERNPLRVLSCIADQESSWILGENDFISGGGRSAKYLTGVLGLSVMIISSIVFHQ